MSSIMAMGQQLQQLNPNEMASTAVATQMAAMVQAQYMVALARPRNWDGVRTRLLAFCRTAQFADEAIYAKPVGNETIRGLSIRFAETARQVLTNMRSSRMTLFEDAERKIVRVTVIDLESNSTEEREVAVNKRIERKKLKRDQVALETRVNSQGETIYIVRPSDDELAIKEGAACAKAERECTLKLMPADIKAEAYAVCEQAILNGAKGPDSEARRKKLVDAFFALGITAEELVAYLGHSLTQTTPPEFVELQGIYAAVRDGDTTWATVRASKSESKADEPAPESKTSRTKDALKARRGEAPAPGAPAPSLVDTIVKAIAAAKSVDELNTHWERIAELTDAEQRKIVQAAGEARLEELNNG
jgi:hypothetical protein